MTDYTAEDAKRDVNEIKEAVQYISYKPDVSVFKLVAWLAERELQDVAIDEALENSKPFKKIVNNLP